MDLLERDEQLESLNTAWATALGGAGSLVFLAGEAGAGKTSVVATFATMITTPGRVLVGACDASSTPRPLGPLVDVSEALEITDQLADPTTTRGSLFATTRRSLGRLPTLFVLEDLHWADEATLDLLEYLGRRLRDQSILVIATYRDDEVSGSHPLAGVLGDLATAPGVTRMSLPPLSEAAVETLAGTRADGIDVRALKRATGGNPFFVTEVLAEGGERVPPTVRDAVLARAARLSSAARAALDAAAVIGSSAPVSLVLEIVRQQSAALDECVARGMLVDQPPARPDGTGSPLVRQRPAVQFRHELTRDAVLASLLPGTRTGLHRRVLGWLSAQPNADHRLIVEHAVACDDNAMILEHAPSAAANAARLGSHREAAELLRIAVWHATEATPAHRADLMERLSYQCYLTDQIAEAIKAQRGAIALHRTVGDQRRVGEAQRWLSRLSWFLGRRPDADQYAQEAVATLEPLGPGPELAMAYSNLSQLAMLGSDSEAALRWGRRAVDLARTVGDRATEAHALNNIGSSLASRGEVAEGLARLNQSLDLALADELEEHAARAWTNLGYTQLCLRRLPEAEQTLRAGVDYCRDRDLDSWWLYMGGHLALVRLEQGDVAAGLETADQVLAHRGVSAVSKITPTIVRALAAIRSGSQEATGLVDEAWSLALVSGEVQRTLPATLVRAEAAWTAGQAAQIPELTEAVWDAARRHGERWLVAELWWWRHLAGADDEPLPDAPEPITLMAEGAARAAGDAWAALHRPFWSALALAGGGPDEAYDAVAGLHRLGATASARAVQRDLAARGLRVPRGPRVTTRANPAGLTARELDVLALLVDGCSDAELAQRLVVSERTASHHVSAVLRKLGVPTRARAAVVGRNLLTPS